MACLALLLEFGFGDRVTAVHIDTGAELPEVHEVLERIRPLVRDVVIVRSDVKEFIKWNGLPTDLVVADNTTFGKQCSHTTTGARVCDKYSCCKANIWDPWMYYAEHCEDTGFIVGDKRHDAYGRMGDEMTFGNKKVEVCHPIKDWSDEDVLAYLYERDFMFGQEKRMSLKHSSFDCWCCSAYWEVAKERLEYLEEFHKDLAVLARRQYEMVRHDAAKKLAVINNILEK